LYLSEERSVDTQLWQLTIANHRRQPFFATLGDRQGGIDCPKLSPDGNVIAAASFQPGRGPQGRSQIWTYTLPNGTPRQLTTAQDGAYDPDWSPDGKQIAYAVRSGARHDIWVMRADGANARAVTTIGACRAPCWSPDGAWITFLSAQSGTFDVWAIPAPSDLPTSTAGTPAAAPAIAPVVAPRAVTRNGVCEASSGLAWA
jgi:TolB protein